MLATNARFLIDCNGNKSRSNEYDPFGGLRAASGFAAMHMLYQTQQSDVESGLYCLRARYYDPLTGTFLSRDPIRGIVTNPQTQTPYAYSLNNPVNLGDPSGEQADSSHTLYGGFNQSTLQYVGITCRDLAVRAAEHANSGDPARSNLIYQSLKTGLDYMTARGGEQTHIDTYGMAKNGGQLVNQVNSIAPNNLNK